MTIYTIGFTKKSAERFFTLLKQSGARRIVDVRLNKTSQLGGFAKRDDLEYFLRAICNMDYVEVPELAPTQTMLDRFRKQANGWDVYESEFLDLMKARAVERIVDRNVISDSCLLCSEHRPDHCHRRLVAEYLGRHWGRVETIHLL